MTDEGSQPASAEPMAALRAAIRGGTSSGLAAWTATGEAGLTMLREVLTGRLDLDLPGVHPRDVIDGLSTSVAAIAHAHSAAFLDVFADPSFDTNSYVITGLGEVNDHRATDRIAKAARSRDQWLRMAAAIALRGHDSAIAVQTLIELLGDPEYLVRYHALRGLGAIGDTTAVTALRSFQGASAVERDLADSVLESIENRGGQRPNTVAGPPISLIAIDHVQLGMPAGGEDAARAFYHGVLGLREVSKPAALAGRGGAWFAGRAVAVHLGVEPGFRPATKAHPAFIVDDLPAVRTRLASAGVETIDDDSGLPVTRCYVRDPFGNRIELIDAVDAGFSVRAGGPSARDAGAS